MMNFFYETISSLSKHSLFSTIISFYTLLLLYFPSLSLQFIFSPVLFSTFILLLYLLRLGATQNPTPQVQPNESSDPAQLDSRFADCDKTWASGTGTGTGTGTDLELRSRRATDDDHGPYPFYADSFVEWDVRAPLEIIHEEYEGDDGEENDGVSEAKKKSDANIIQRYASLSLFYPESDSDCSSDGDSPTYGNWDSPENMYFRWEEEDDREGLIEIALGEKRNCEVDEENLIEIDLSPAR